jgi:hypothetical protein
VVVQVARSAGIVAENVFSTTIAASLISILLNVFIVRGAFAWLDRDGSEPEISKSRDGGLAPAMP